MEDVIVRAQQWRRWVAVLVGPIRNDPHVCVGPPVVVRGEKQQKPTGTAMAILPTSSPPDNQWPFLFLASHKIITAAA